MIDLEWHLETEHETEGIQQPKFVVCNECGAQFIDSASLEFHIREKHTLSEHSPCNLCGLVLASLSMLQKHVNDFHEPKVECCKYCKFSTTNMESLQDHMILAHEEMVILHTMAAVLTSVFDTAMSFSQR